MMTDWIIISLLAALLFQNSRYSKFVGYAFDLLVAKIKRMVKR